LAFAGGIWSAEWAGVDSSLWVLVALVGLSVLSIPGPAVSWGLSLALLGGGGLAYRATQLPVDPGELRWQLAGQPALGSVRGRLLESPSIRLSERRGVWTERTVVRVGIEDWKGLGRDWVPASGIVAVSSKGVPDERFFRGQRVEITGAVGPPGDALATGLLDYATFLRRQGIGIQLLCAAPADWALAPGALEGPPWGERFLAWARERLARGLPDDESTRLIWAMALGWKTALNGDMDDVFMRSGTMHVFAISGLHIALIALLLVRLLRLVRLPRAGCGLLAAPLIWFYVAATGWQPSAIRSAVMTSVVVGTWSLERPSDLLNSLAAAALVVLIWEPGQLFQAGFLLSFLVVGALPVLGPPLEELLLALPVLMPDPLLPEALWSKVRRWGEGFRRWGASGLATGGASLLASLPFTIGYFHLFSPVALLANLIVVPLSGLVLVANAVSLACPLGVEVWNSAAWLGMHGMIQSSRGFAALPCAWFSVATPPFLIWIPYGWLLLGLGAGWFRTSGVRRKWLSVAGLLALICGPVCLLPPPGTRILVFGAGEAVWIDRSGRSKDLLLDTGDAIHSEQAVIPSLRAQGVNALRRLVVSHGDIRHVGGAGAVFEAFHPGSLVLPALRMRSASFRGLDTLAHRAGIPVQRVAEGQTLADWEVVHPGSGDSFPRADDGSLTLMGEVEGWRVLLAPDLGKAGQETLMRRHEGKLAADVLITGVPREGAPATEAFLTAVAPRLLIVATGTHPATERTPRSQRLRLRNRPFQVLYTEDLGALDLRFGPGLEVWNMRGEVVWASERVTPQGMETAR
jgi:ComEC/Rec2-related protein